MPKSILEEVKKAKALVPSISADEAKELIGRPGVICLDVRDGDEVTRSGKIAGAINISRGMLEFKADKDAPLYDKQFDDANTIIVYCASGARSALSCKTLIDMGYADVRDLGTLNDWMEVDGALDR